MAEENISLTFLGGAGTVTGSKTLLEFDAQKIDIILAHGISKKGLGLGVMNRLGKAAHKKIRV